MTLPDEVQASRRPLAADAVADRLPAGWRVRVVASTGSTNADLLAAAATGEPDRSVLVAELQTQGRGRLDRGWQSPPGAGLTLTALVRPDVPVTRWGWLPLLAGVAVARSVGADASLKWPNDVLLGADQRKLAGLLVQNSGPAAVIGIGLNVSTTEAELPVPTATSLYLHGRAELDREQLLIDLVGELDAQLNRWLAAGGDAAGCGLAEEYRGLCATIGQPVEVQLPERREQGIAVTVDDDGRLVLDAGAGGRPRVVAAGDVTHVRASRR